jgi:hypothetical protein
MFFNLPTTRILAGATVIIGGIPSTDAQPGFFITAGCAVTDALTDLLADLTLEIVDEATSTVLDSFTGAQGAAWQVADTLANDLPPSVTPAATGGLILRLRNDTADTVLASAWMCLVPDLIDAAPLDSTPSTRRPATTANVMRSVNGIQGLQSYWTADDLMLADAAAVALWQDLSGHGHHATQGTGGDRPSFDAPTPGVDFAGVANDQFLTLVTPLYARTVFAVVRAATRASAGYNYVLGLSSDANQGFAIPPNTGTTAGNDFFMSESGAVANAYESNPTELRVLVGLHGGTWQVLRKNGYAGIPVTSDTPFQFDRVGRGATADTDSPLEGTILCCGSFSRCLSYYELSELERILGLVGSVTLNAKPQLIIEGSGIANGDIASTPWHELVAADLTTWDIIPASATNKEIEAATATGLALMLSNHRARNIVLVWSGASDLLADGETGTDVYDIVEEFCTTVRAAGAHVIIATELPRNSPGIDVGYEDERAIYNAAVIAGYQAFADTLIDLTEIAGIGEVSDLSGANYEADEWHLSDAGNAIVANAIQAVLTDL